MPDMIWGKIPVVRKSLNEAFLRQGDVADPNAFGAIPRDYDVDPVQMGDSPDQMDLMTDDELDAAAASHEVNQSSLVHIFLRGDKPAFPHLDQNGHGYCWSYSTGHCIMFDRMKQNLNDPSRPMVRVNPHATAAIIKNGADQGGWSGQSMKWGREHGYAIEGNGPGQWPLHSRNLKYDTPELRASMALHKVEEDWYDFGKREYDQKLTKRQILTSVMQNNPCTVDYNRFGHAMAAVGAVKIGNVWVLIIMNSWKQFGHYGLAGLYDMWPDNSNCLRATTPSDR